MKRLMLLLLGIHLLSPTFIFSQTNITEGPVSGTWTKAESPYLIQGNILIEEGSNMIIEPGAIIEFMGHYSMTIEGNLKASGTAEEMIQFTKSDTTGLSGKVSPN
ncbi:MAG: hypothetical protein KAI81_01200, partial [Candidatus Marinimicrobia bacterium]|nr:hypothetical protein [Candidatus Neomarinimicrobiota bacterium]